MICPSRYHCRLARLIGSLVQWYPRTTAIVLDTPSSPDAVYTFYQERLPAMGWRSWTGSKVASGFVDDTPYFWSKQYVHPRFFGRGARHADIFYRGSPLSYDDGNGRPGPVLFVHATAKPDESTEVRLWLAEDEHGVAGMGLEDANPRLMGLLPVLTPPEGTRQRSTGGGSSRMPRCVSASHDASLNLIGKDFERVPGLSVEELTT